MKETMLGLSVVEEFIVKCGDCSTPLINIVVSETNEARQSRGFKPLNSSYKVVNCHKCNGSSFWTKIFSGSTNISSFTEKLEIDLEDTDVKDNVVYSKLRISNRK